MERVTKRLEPSKCDMPVDCRVPGRGPALLYVSITAASLVTCLPQYDH